MQAFFGMMADSCGKVLKIAAGAASGSLVRLSLALAPCGILATRRAGHSVERALAEKVEQSAASFGRLFRPGLLWSNVGQIEADDIGDWNLGNVALTALWRVLARDVVGERPFSLSKVSLAESSADLVSGVFDDPCCALGALVVTLAGWPEPQVRTSGVTRHRPNIL